MSVRKSAAIFAAACLAIAPLAGAAVTYTFQDGDVNGYNGTQDLTVYYINDVENNINAGADISIYVGYSSRALLRFDNLGSLTGQTVQSATLTLYTSANSYGTHEGDATSHPASIYAFENENVGWQQGVGHYSNVASSGEATGAYLSYNTTPWPNTAALTGFNTSDVLAPLDTQTFPYLTDGVAITFTLPAPLVQQWVDGGANPGLIVDSSEYYNGIQFQSSEFATASGRPLLTVTTAVPEPASMAVLGLVGLGLMGRRSRK
ncbi:MAG: DNRLRE domain-containing protein [Phycisphaerales bacterium]|nr:DNRLRE domain-containing protein [Phycisphaerales bacterium]